jgi:uncharacterized protein
MTWMQTHSGRAVDLADPDPSTICLDDIAFALSGLCRYSGHVKHYSVAEHCWLISQAMERDYPNDPAVALAGLLHDAHEAYTGDISYPMQLALGSDVRAEIKRVQHRIDDAIRIALKIPIGVGVAFHDNRVKDADRRILIDERDALLGPSPRGPWEIELQGGKPLGVKVGGRPASVAREWFVDRFERLHHEVSKLPLRGDLSEMGT